VGRRARVLITGTGYRAGEGYQVGTPTDRPELAGHLKMMHGVWIGTTEKLPDLIECHRLAHEDAFGPEIKHTHRILDTPDEEWVW